MNHIVLTNEQAQVVEGRTQPIEVRDEKGRVLGQLTLLSPEDIAAIERWKRSRGKGGPGIPTEQVLAHLRRLGEIRDQKGLDEPTMHDLLRRMRAGEQV